MQRRPRLGRDPRLGQVTIHERCALSRLAGRCARQVALKLHTSLKRCELRQHIFPVWMPKSSVCVRVRKAYLRVARLENRQSFTGLVRSNLTVSAISLGPLGGWTHGSLSNGWQLTAIDPIQALTSVCV